MARKGVPKSREHRAKIAAALIGKPKSVAARAAMSAAKTGKPGRKLTDAERAHISACRKGKPLSAEHREKLRQAKLRNPVRHWRGKVRGRQSDESQAKRSASLKGKPATYPLQRFYYKGAPMRSTYEVRAAQAFDALGIQWVYESRRFDLGDCTYLPDFYLPALETYVEVKGWYGPKSATTVSRMFAVCPDVAVAILQQTQIEELEMLAASAPQLMH